jgi:hypothetical protein
LWNTLPKNKKKKINGFLKEDLVAGKWPLSLKDGLKNIKFLYRVDEKKHFVKLLADGLRRTWIKGTIKTIIKSSGFNGNGKHQAN